MIKKKQPNVIASATATDVIHAKLGLGKSQCERLAAATTEENRAKITKAKSAEEVRSLLTTAAPQSVPQEPAKPKEK